MHKVSIECVSATSSVQTHRICSNRRPQCAMATCHRFKTIQTIFGRLQCCLEALDFKGFSMSNKLYNWKQIVNSNGRDKTLNNHSHFGVFCWPPKMKPRSKVPDSCQVFKVDVYRGLLSKRGVTLCTDHPSLFGRPGIEAKASSSPTNARRCTARRSNA